MPGEEAAAAGRATNARSESQRAINRMSLTRALPRSRPNHRQTPTFVPNCKNFHFGTENVDDYIVSIN